MIKAAMVTPNLTLGGAERWVVDMVKHSDPTRVRWTGVACSSYGGCDQSLATELRAHVPLYANRCLGRPAHAKPFFWPAIKEITGPDFRLTVQEACKDADVIVTWGSPDLSYFLGPFKVPKIVCSHTTRREDKPRPVTGVTHLAAVSEAAMKYFDGRQGNNLPRRVIYNGADPVRCRATRTRREVRAAWKLTEGHVVVGYLGRQSPEKNPLAPAEAICEMPSKYHAVYVGVGPQGDGVCEDTFAWCEHHVPGRFHMFPPTAAVGNVLAGFDVLMLASFREAFSLTLIEAWLAGVPVVATPVGSVPEVQRRFGDMVFLVPCKPTPEELRLAITMATTRPLRRRIVERAQRVALEHFTVRKMVERWTTYLEEVVSGRC